MADSNNENTTQKRRMSLVDMFSGRVNLSSSPPMGNASTSAETSQHKRGASISTIGLAGSGPGQSSPYNAFAKQRRASISTSSAASSPEFRNTSGDDPAVIDEDEPLRTSHGSPPSPSFARRLSFGAQALRDVRQGGTAPSSGGRSSSSSLYALHEDASHFAQPHSRSPETAKAGGEGFNWSDALRDRTKRTPSFSSSRPFGAGINRAKSTGTAPLEPPKEMPKPNSPPSKLQKPDHIGERMLRGDFMMD